MKISELNKLQLGSILYFNNDSYNYILVGYSNTTILCKFRGNNREGKTDFAYIYNEV